LLDEVLSTIRKDDVPNAISFPRNLLSGEDFRPLFTPIKTLANAASIKIIELPEQGPAILECPILHCYKSKVNIDLAKESESSAKRLSATAFKVASDAMGVFQETHSFVSKSVQALGSSYVYSRLCVEWLYQRERRSEKSTLAHLKFPANLSSRFAESITGLFTNGGASFASEFIKLIRLTAKYYVTSTFDAEDKSKKETMEKILSTYVHNPTVLFRRQWGQIQKKRLKKEIRDRNKGKAVKAKTFKDKDYEPVWVVNRASVSPGKVHLYGGEQVLIDRINKSVIKAEERFTLAQANTNLRLVNNLIAAIIEDIHNRTSNITKALLARKSKAHRLMVRAREEAEPDNKKRAKFEYEDWLHIYSEHQLEFTEDFEAALKTNELYLENVTARAFLPARTETALLTKNGYQFTDES
jgi:hypothetical protein